jgi:cardiolipin synthase
MNGNIAYPTILQSIRSAKRHIVLSSYIFDSDQVGGQFVNALAQAHQRGVTVNVLLDRIGIGYSWHKTNRALRKSGVKTTLFLPTNLLTSIRFINLRNHRKILCVDGEVGSLKIMGRASKRMLEPDAIK